MRRDSNIFSKSASEGLFICSKIFLRSFGVASSSSSKIPERTLAVIFSLRKVYWRHLESIYMRREFFGEFKFLAHPSVVPEKLASNGLPESILYFIV